MKAFVTGCNGQDGSYLCEQLLTDGYEVHGLIRRSSVNNLARLGDCVSHPNFHLHHGDLTDRASLEAIVLRLRPDEIFNLGAQSHVRVSFDAPHYTTDTIVGGTLALLEAARKYVPGARFYQASSSEMFGDVLENPQRETTPFKPQSPYGCAKVAAHYLVDFYRRTYGMNLSCGILFNHESERRGEAFVTRKITRALARIVAGKQKVLALGNLWAKRDWGYAPEFVTAMRSIIKTSSDFVVATGETHTVKEFLEEACRLVNLDSQKFLVIDGSLCREAEVDILLGDASRARAVLGWQPTVRFTELVRRMLTHDLLVEGIHI